jgi:hypothetical protein
LEERETEEKRGVSTDDFGGVETKAMKLGVVGYSSMRKELLITSCLAAEEHLEEQLNWNTCLRRDPEMFNKAVRGWNLFQAITNEYALKRYIELERSKGFGNSSGNLWTSKSVRTRLNGIWELGERKMREITMSKSSSAQTKKSRKSNQGKHTSKKRGKDTPKAMRKLDLQHEDSGSPVERESKEKSRGRRASLDLRGEKDGGKKKTRSKKRKTVLEYE